MLLFFWTSVSYAIGCVNAAYYLLRLRSGADIRVLGSGNAGARNAGRLLGRPTFFLVLLFDAARGVLAVWGAYQLGLGDGGAIAAALAVTAGHVWPVQLGFRGGKGVSVAAGALLVLDGWLVLGASAVFGLAFGWRRRVTPSGLVAIATIPAWAFLFGTSACDSGRSRPDGGCRALRAPTRPPRLFPPTRHTLPKPYSALAMTKMTKTPLAFRVASTPEEFAQIYRLNHQTFAEEIPQHAPSEDGLLRDRFDAENTYVVAVRGDRVVGMIAVRGRRPFSLDAKLPDLDAHLPPAQAVCEVRLLAVERAHRTGIVFRGLVAQLADVCLERGYDLVLISGTTRQLRLYRHLGFVPFGPLVGSPEAQYQPMYLTLDGFRRHERTFARRATPLLDASRGASAGPPSNFLPGPVNISPPVRAALMEPPISHRGKPFMDKLACIRQRLCALTNAPDVQILLGSGTLANDVVGGQLRLLNQPGLVLVNGEFGERLVDHARRLGLSFQTHRVPWGETFDWSRVAAALAGYPEAGWLWAVHCETSTGVVTRLDRLCEISRLHGVPARARRRQFARQHSGRSPGRLPCQLDQWQRPWLFCGPRARFSCGATPPRTREAASLPRPGPLRCGRGRCLYAVVQPGPRPPRRPRPP